MPQSSHNQGAELHSLATHAHAVAAVSHGKTDHLSAHELSIQDHENSREEEKLSEHLEMEAVKSAEAKTGTGQKEEVVHVIRPGLPL